MHNVDLYEVTMDNIEEIAAKAGKDADALRQNVDHNRHTLPRYRYFVSIEKGR